MDLATRRLPRSRKGRSKAATSPTLTGQLLQAGCAHIDEELGGRRQLGPGEFHRFRAEHPEAPLAKWTVPDQGMRADTPHTGEAHEAVCIDMAGDQADLVHVGCQHDAPAVFALFAFADDQVAKGIHAHLIGQGFHFETDDFPDGRL